MNLERLAKIRDFLMTNDVPFQMEYIWSRADDPNNTTIDGPTEGVDLTKDMIDAGAKGCGTAGCVAGWTPFVFPELCLFYTGSLEVRGTDTFTTVIEHSWYSFLTQFIASSDWQEYDHTRLGAAFRIDCVINDINPFTEGESLYEPEENDDAFYLDDIFQNIDRKLRYYTLRDEWIAKTGAK